MKRLILLIALLTRLPLCATEVDGLLVDLPKCLEMARTHNRKLQNAALDIQAATEQRREAFTNYFPMISANVMAFKAFDKFMKMEGSYPMELGALGQMFHPLIGQPYSVEELDRMFSAGISLVQPVFAGGQIVTGNKLAKLQEEVSYLQRSLTEKEVVQKVTECYWQYCMLTYNLNTLNAAEKQLEAVMQQVQNCIEAGVTTRNAAMKVKLQQQDIASKRLQVENAQRVLRSLLQQQIGAEKRIIIKTDALNVTIPPQPQDAQTAVFNREELQLAAKGIEAQQLQVRMERGKLLPTVAVGFMGFHMRMGGITESELMPIKNHMTNGMVFGTVSVPISQWWGGSKAIKRQKIKLQQAQNQYDEAREGLLIDLQATWNKVEEAYKQIELARETVAEAAENLRMSTECYRVGKETLTDLLDAETLHRKAHDQLSSALASYQILWSDYCLKVGLP